MGLRHQLRPIYFTMDGRKRIRTVVVRACLQCSKNFECKDGSNSKFCTIKCGKAHRKKLLAESAKSIVACLNCDELFERPGDSTSSYCTIACRNEYRTHPPVTKQCAVCTNEFTVSYKKRDKNPTCGVECGRKLAVQNTDWASIGEKIGERNRLYPTTVKGPDIELTCEWIECGKQFTVPYGLRYQQFCDKSCSSSYSNSVKDQEAIGRKISASRIEGIAAGRITFPGYPHTDETREHLSDMFSGGRRAGENNAMFGRHHRDDSRDAMSKTRAQNIVDGKTSPTSYQGKSGTAKTRLGEFHYRSLYEKKLIEVLTADHTVLSLEGEPISIPYYRTESGRQHLRHYIPDFIVLYTDGHRELIEVKPTYLLDAEINVAKAEAAREYCEAYGLKHRFVTEHDLFADGSYAAYRREHKAHAVEETD